jgi:hypothetical protein
MRAALRVWMSCRLSCRSGLQPRAPVLCRSGVSRDRSPRVRGLRRSYRARRATARGYKPLLHGISRPATLAR